MPALLQAKTTLISPDNLVTIGRYNTLKQSTTKILLKIKLILLLIQIIMKKFIRYMLSMVTSSCCFAMAIIAIVSYNQLVCNISNGVIIFVIAGVFVSGIISAYEFIRTYNEIFLK